MITCLDIRNQAYNSATEWSSFVRLHHKGNVFQTPEMFFLSNENRKSEPLVTIAVNDCNEITGLNQAFIIKENPGILGKVSARSIITGGPLFPDNNPEVLDKLLKFYKDQIKGKAIYSQFRNHWKWSDAEKMVFESNGFHFTDHLNIIIDLNHENQVLFHQLHPGRRKNIRRAEKIPLVFEIINNESDIRKCGSLIRKTYQRIKMPCPDQSFFEGIFRQPRLDAVCKVFAARHMGEIISCRIELCYKNMIIDWYAGTDYNHLNKYPNDFLIWNILVWGRENSFSVFDFGGAGTPGTPYGVRDYKLKFGGVLVNYGRFEMVHNKMLMWLGKIGMKLYKIL